MACREQRSRWEAEQRQLALLRRLEDDLDWCAEDFEGLRRVAGCDVSFFRDKSYAVATVVVLSFPRLELLWHRSAAFRLSVPYVPGFLAFREVPALAQLLRHVPEALCPQAVLVDGNGAFHPRGCGAATHLGLTVALPTLGVAKEVLKVGAVTSATARHVAQRLAPNDWRPLCDVAALLRPAVGKPLVVSPGHRMSLETSVRLCLKLCDGKSSPEPVRQADQLSRRAVQAWLQGKEVDYLPNPRLRHLERIGELTSEPVKPKKLEWKVKVEVVREPERWGIFGWLCTCMSRSGPV